MTYELRKMKATDLFLVLKLVKKVGVANFADVVFSKGFQMMFGDAKAENKEDEAEVGRFVFAFLELITDRLSDCQEEIFDILEAVSNLTREQLENDLGMDEFLAMIFEVASKKEFVQLFSRVVSLLTKEK